MAEGGIRDWVEEAAADLETAEGFTDDYADQADRYVMRAIAKALIGIAGVMTRGEQGPDRSGKVW